MKSSSSARLIADHPKRRQARRHFLDIDHITLEASDQQSRSLQFSVQNLTSFGALIKCTDIGNTDIAVGSTLSNVKLNYNSVEIGKFESAKVCFSQTSGNALLLGLSFHLDRKSSDKSVVKVTSLERRKSKRVSAREGYQPYASAKHPFLYDQVMHFLVHDISIDGALISFDTDNTNVPLLKGATLEEVEIYLPTVGIVKADAKVMNVGPIEGSDQLGLGIQFQKLSPQFSQLISKYLLSFGAFNNENALNNLRLAGFKPKFLKSHLTFSHVVTDEEYAQVLELRREAYSRVKKIDDDTTAEKMKDLFDFNSIIIIAKSNDKVVGSVRLTYCKKPEDQFELDHSISIPKSIPRDSAVEISRLCVRNDFEHTDLVFGLIERCTEMTNKMGMRYVISSCVDSMVPYYKKLGFQITGLTFELKTLNNLLHYFILHDLRGSQYSYKMNPLYWNFTYKQISSYLNRFGFITKNKMNFLKRIYLEVLLKINQIKTKSK